MNSTENTVCALTGSTPHKNAAQPENDTTKISGIYKIINRVNGKYYVGSSVNVLMRWRKHKEALRRNQHRNRYLQRAWNKIGAKSFEFMLVESISQHELEPTEQKYLDLAKTEMDKTYNLSFVADRIEMTEEVKRILRDLALIRYKSIQNHPMYGKKHEAETIFKIKTTLHGIMAGSRNPNCDPNPYEFFNDNTHELFIGTRYDFCQKYHIHSSRVSAVINHIGRCKRISRWRTSLPTLA